VSALAATYSRRYATHRDAVHDGFAVNAQKPKRQNRRGVRSYTRRCP
jgi:hypothetical protein